MISAFISTCLYFVLVLRDISLDVEFECGMCFFFQHLKNYLPLSPGIHCFWKRVRCTFYLFPFMPCDCLSACSSNVFLKSVLWLTFFILIQLKVCCASYCIVLFCFAKWNLETFLSISLQISFSLFGHQFYLLAIEAVMFCFVFNPFFLRVIYIVLHAHWPFIILLFPVCSFYPLIFFFNFQILWFLFFVLWFPFGSFLLFPNLS